MKRYLFVFVFLLLVLVGCQSATSETAVAPEPTAPPPTPTPIPPTPTPLPPTAAPETAVHAELADALQALVDEQVHNGFPGVILMVEAPDMDFSWKGAGGMADWDGLYYGLGVLNVRFAEWGMPEIGDVLGNISVWNGFVNYWPQYNVVFAGTLNQAKPLDSYTMLQGATVQTMLPYVIEE